jgi:hypothetical protein
LKSKLEELQRQLDKCREEHRVTKGELEECEKEGFKKSSKHKLELAKCQLEKEQLKAEKDELERQLERTRKAALVFMAAADTYQEDAEKLIKAKVEELENTRKASVAFMDAADRLVFFISQNSPKFSKFLFYSRGPIKFDISQIFPFFHASTQTTQIQLRDGPALVMFFSCFYL